MPVKTVWGKEGMLDEAIRLFKDEGLSHAKIADKLTKQFGVRVTKNAITGKLYREGYGGTIESRKISESFRVKRQRRQKAKNLVPPKPKSIRAADFMASGPLPEAQPDDIARISFNELEDNLCHWVPGDPSEGDPLYAKKYCGLDVDELAPAPYCRAHLQRYFRPIEQQPRDIRRSVIVSASNPIPVKEDA